MVRRVIYVPVIGPGPMFAKALLRVKVLHKHQAFSCGGAKCYKSDLVAQK